MRSPPAATTPPQPQPKPSRSVPDFRHHQQGAQGRSASIANDGFPSSPSGDIGAAPKHTPSPYKGRIGHLRHRARTLSRSRKISHGGTSGDDESIFGCRTAASEDSPRMHKALPLPGGHGGEATPRAETPKAKESPSVPSPPEDLNRHQAGCTTGGAKDGIKHFWEATKHLASTRLTTARSHPVLLEPLRLSGEEREPRPSNGRPSTTRSPRSLAPSNSVSDYGHSGHGNKRDTYVFSPHAELPPRTRPAPAGQDTVLPRVIARHEQILPQRQEAEDGVAGDVDAAPRVMSVRHSRANTIDDTESTVTRETWRVDTNSVAGSPWVPMKALLEPVQLTQVVEVNDDAEREYPAPDSGVSFNPAHPATEKSFEAARYSRTPHRSSPLRHSTSEADMVYYYPTAGPAWVYPGNGEEKAPSPAPEARSVASIPDVGALLAVHKKKRVSARISSSGASRPGSRVSSSCAGGPASRVSSSCDSGLGSWDELAFLADEIHSRESSSPASAERQRGPSASEESLTRRAKERVYSASVGGSTFDGDVAWESDLSGAVGSASDSYSNVGTVGFSPIIEDHPYRYGAQASPALDALAGIPPTGQPSPSGAQQFRFPRPPTDASHTSDQRKVGGDLNASRSTAVPASNSAPAVTISMADQRGHAPSPSLSSLSSAATNLSRFGFPSILDGPSAQPKDGGAAGSEKALPEPPSATSTRSYSPLRRGKNQHQPSASDVSVGSSGSRSSRQYLRGPSWALPQPQAGAQAPLAAQTTGMSGQSHRHSKSIDSLASSFATGHTEYSSNFLHGLRSHAAESAKAAKSDADAGNVGHGEGLPGAHDAVGLGVVVPADGSASGQNFLSTDLEDEDSEALDDPVAHPPLTSSASTPAALSESGEYYNNGGNNGSGKQLPPRAGHGHRRLKSSIDLLERAAMGTISESS